MPKLKKTKKCKKCPWKKNANPHDIPNGYDVKRHQNLAATIANADDVLSQLGQTENRVMACHETHNCYCVGWLHNQLGPGNNIVMRLKMLNYENAGEIEVVGEQHQRFEDTLPSTAR